MLSSVANRIYWTARYLERVENTARIINVYSGFLLDLPEQADASWQKMIEISGCAEEFVDFQRGSIEDSAIRYMTSELSNSSSIQSSLRMARENMRTLRDAVPKEAFESVNELYLFGQQQLSRAANRRTRYLVLQEVIQNCQQITGLFAGTMSHNQTYQFMRLGRNLERADMTSRILDAAGDFLASDDQQVSEYETTLWVNVLRTLSAYQAYRQSVRSRIAPVRVLHFLLNDAFFPRSIVHCVTEMSNSIQLLPGHDAVGRVIEEVGHTVDEFNLRALARESLRDAMNELQIELGIVHDTVSQSWFSPADYLARGGVTASAQES